jgi:hypothetical protein
MIPLLVAFFIIGSAMCALISLDRHSGADSGAIECDSLEIKPPHSTGVELLPGLTVESGHTAAGLARDQ